MTVMMSVIYKINRIGPNTDPEACRTVPLMVLKVRHDGRCYVSAGPDTNGTMTVQCCLDQKKFAGAEEESYQMLQTDQVELNDGCCNNDAASH